MPKNAYAQVCMGARKSWGLMKAHNLKLESCNPCAAALLFLYEDLPLLLKKNYGVAFFTTVLFRVIDISCILL